MHPSSKVEQRLNKLKAKIALIKKRELKKKTALVPKARWSTTDTEGSFLVDRPADFPDNFILFTEALKSLGFSRQSGFRWRRAGAIKTLKVGRLLWISKPEFESFKQGKIGVAK